MFVNCAQNWYNSYDINKSKYVTEIKGIKTFQLFGYAFSSDTAVTDTMSVIFGILFVLAFICLVIFTWIDKNKIVLGISIAFSTLQLISIFYISLYIDENTSYLNKHNPTAVFTYYLCFILIGIVTALSFMSVLGFPKFLNDMFLNNNSQKIETPVCQPAQLEIPDKYCSMCGNRLRGDATFCTSCGHRFED